MTLFPDMEIPWKVFLGAVGSTFFETWNLFKKGFMDCSIITDG